MPLCSCEDKDAEPLSKTKKKHAQKPFNNDMAKRRRMQQRRNLVTMLEEAYDWECAEFHDWDRLLKDGYLEVESQLEAKEKELNTLKAQLAERNSDLVRARKDRDAKQKELNRLDARRSEALLVLSREHDAAMQKQKLMTQNQVSVMNKVLEAEITSLKAARQKENRELQSVRLGATADRMGSEISAVVRSGNYNRVGPDGDVSGS